MSADFDTIQDLIRAGSPIWREEGGILQKRCPACKANGRPSWHPLDEFSDDDATVGGLHGYCKACTSTAWREWQKRAGYK